jgi:hypothetical protein
MKGICSIIGKAIFLYAATALGPTSLLSNYVPTFGEGEEIAYL